MNILPVITDNIAELLTKIIDFTNYRRKILIGNINNVDSPEFYPQDLAVEEFSSVLNSAIAEHCQTSRLLLFDTASIKFGPNASISAEALFDSQANELLEDNRDEYLDSQLNKLLENTLNQKIARELLRHHQGSRCSELLKRTNGR